MTYVCPMHPEIERKRAGKCPKCGMDLVKKGSEKDLPYQTQSPVAKVVAKYMEKLGPGYQPLIVIFISIFLVSLVLSIFHRPFSIFQLITYFMGFFFLVFAFFKLVDLRGFAEGYATYDILAKEWYGYGFLYPIIELLFGLSMFLNKDQNILKAEIVIMIFSGLGVVLKLRRHEKFQCACLGTFLKVPLTKVTLLEDFGMAFLAAVLLFW